MRFAAPNASSQTAFVRLPGRLRRALKVFRKITGLTAVTSLAPSLPDPGTPVAFPPLLHPQCIGILRSVPNAPCGEQWLIHLRTSRRSGRAHSHTCPVGLRCSCVPIHFGGRLVGVAKLVAGPRTSDAAFSAAMVVLKLVVSEACQSAAVSVLSREMRALRRRLASLRRIRARDGRGAARSGPPSQPSGVEVREVRSGALVDRALAYLQHHYREPALSLIAVARALGCNPRYLTSRFTEVAGERMRTHLIALRVSHACRLLVDTDMRVKEIAHESGFTGPGRLASTFRRHVGISPGEYRRIFSGP